MNEYDSYYSNDTQPDHQPQNFPEYSSGGGWNQSQPQKPKQPRKKGGLKLVALALCCSILGGVLGAGAMMWVQRSSLPEGLSQQEATVLVRSSRQASQLQIVQTDPGEEKTAAQVYAENVQSTVGITTSITTNYFGFQTTSAASGSGFIISTDGYILTNHHVIEDASSITVSLYDGRSYEAALIGYDKSNDIAVLKIEAEEDLAPVILGDSDSLNVGDPVVAIGNPLGELTFSLTAGYVSAKDRQVTFSGGTTMNLIQTDAAINSGNSGGALFNMYGEVVGVTNAKYSSSSSSEASIDNIGFAIPINSIMEIVQSIIEKGYISKPYIGVQVIDVGTEARRYGLPQGAAIYSVVEDSPAEKGGLQANDIVTQANGTEITCGNDLVTLVQSLTPGDELNLTVYRQGQNLELTVIVEEQIQSALEQEATEPVEQSSQDSWGMFPWGFLP